MNNKTKGILLVAPFTALAIYVFATNPDVFLPFLSLLGVAIMFVLALFGVSLYLKDD